MVPVPPPCPPPAGGKSFVLVLVLEFVLVLFPPHEGLQSIQSIPSIQSIFSPRPPRDAIPVVCYALPTIVRLLLQQGQDPYVTVRVHIVG